MKKSRGILLLFAAVVILGGCKKNGSGNPDLQPVVTPVGTIDGTAKTQTIGSAGGTIVSDDGEMELIIPSGALSANTDITIQPITNKAPNGRRKAYRCLPDGLTFSKDITIRFHYTEADAAATTPEYMMVAFQTDEGNWQVIDNVNNDVAGKTISVAINHFTDFSAFDIMRIEPAALYLKTNETGEYKVTATGMSDLNAVLLLTAVLERPETWKVNGVTGGNSTYGTIAASSDGTKGIYHAPGTAPDPNPVDISVEYNLSFTVDGQRFNRGILTAKAHIIGARYRVELEFKGTSAPGTGEVLRVEDNVRMSVNLVGNEGTVTETINVPPTFIFTSPSTNGCTTSFTSHGTGPINLRDIDVIGVNRNSMTGDVYIYFASDVGTVPAKMKITCPSNTTTQDFLPWSSAGAVLTFKDNGQMQVIDMSQLSSQSLKLIATPIQ
jgi:hypothetical protein